MTVNQVYKTYQTPQILQEYMLRVTSFTTILLDGWIGIPIDKNAIIKACTIAKPMTFDLDKQAGYGMSESAVEKRRLFQIELKTKYISSWVNLQCLWQCNQLS